MRILLSAMLMLAAFAAVAPTTSATCIDSSPDDNGVGTTNCNVPLVGNCHVLVYGDLPGLSNGCSPIVCVRECVPIDCVQDCDGPATSSQLACRTSADPSTASLSATCPVGLCEVGPVVAGGRYDHAVSCEPLIVCVTEPCPGSGRIEI